MRKFLSRTFCYKHDFAKFSSATASKKNIRKIFDKRQKLTSNLKRKLSESDLFW